MFSLLHYFLLSTIMSAWELSRSFSGLSLETNLKVSSSYCNKRKHYHIKRDSFCDLQCYENVEEEEESFYDPEFYENGEEEDEEEEEEEEEEKWIEHYSSFQKILLVGEGDFSFSTSLAMAFGSASNMIATSLDSRGFLSRNYGRAMSNIDYLISKGCRVMHGVDATEMAENPLLEGMKFDRIVFNFPFAGFFKTESRQSQLYKHKLLVSLFLKNAREMINDTGEIHITHKTNAFHREWNLVYLAHCQELELIEAVDFDCSDYPGYENKCGFGGDNGFNCNPSKTYKFEHRGTNKGFETIPMKNSRLILQEHVEPPPLPSPKSSSVATHDDEKFEVIKNFLMETELNNTMSDGVTSRNIIQMKKESLSYAISYFLERLRNSPDLLDSFYALLVD